jgi:predicted component of type VI protein secretion system
MTSIKRAAIDDIVSIVRADREAERANLALLVGATEDSIRALREHHLAASQAMQDHYNHTINAMTGIFDRLVTNEENRLVVLREQLAALDRADGGDAQEPS